MGKSKDYIAKAEELQPILEKIYNILKDKIDIKSLWMFRHVPQIYSFKSWGYLAIDDAVKEAYNDLEEKVTKQIIPEDIGSIGKAFKQEKENQDWLFVPNTYGAPEGTIVELDLRLGHQSVLFVPFKDKDDNDIISILLLSTNTIFTKEDVAKKQQELKETFKKCFITDLIRLAYRNERNKDVIANVKKATMDFVGTGITTVKETMKDIVSSDNTTPEEFVRKHFISPIKEFNQGISFVPIIEIEDKHHLQNPLWGYSDVVYDKLQQRLSESIKSEDYKEGSNNDALVLNFTNNLKPTRFSILLGQGYSITYVLNGKEGVGKAMQSDAETFREDAEDLIQNFCQQCDPETILIIKKKYISEKLNQTYKDYCDSPFYLVLEKSDFSLNTGTLTFDKELIASNLNDKTFPLDDYREELIGENGFYNPTAKEYQSKIDGLVFKVYTDEERKKEEIFNEDVKAFIDQRCLYYKLLIDQKQAKKDAVRAAIAQVMARNMSHNFGSHVYSHLIDDKVYTDLKDYQVKSTLKSYTPLFANKEVFKRREDHQLQYFFQYQKSRMDYLSEITFGVPNLMTTKMMYDDVMKELDHVRILLNHISGVSGFKYKFSLKYNNKSLKSNDIGVAFPSDVLGCHAFYNIIENIIRNTAKHAGNQGDKPITFTIHFKDIKGKGCDGVEGVDELYCVEIDNGVLEDGIEELVKHQNERFNKSVLENNKLRSSSLGLLEMEASAAFLRQIDMPEIESDDYEVNEDKDIYFHERPNDTKILNIIRAFAVAVKDEGVKNEKGELVKTGRLGYRFFVQKPKEFLIVGKSVEKNTEKQLLNYGIQIISKKRFIKTMNDEKSFAHQFLLYADNDDIAEEIEKKYNSDYKSLLPLRKLKINDEDWKTISGYWSNLNSDTQLNGETKPEEILNNNKTILQRLKVWSWEKYYSEIFGWKDELKVRVEVERDKDNKITAHQVVFLNHGTCTQHKADWEGSIEMDRRTCKNISKQGAKQCKKFEVWIENLTSKTWGKLPKFNDNCQGTDNSPQSMVSNYVRNLEGAEEEKLQIRKEIFEAYHNKVIVIDERVQKFANDNVEGKDKDKIPSKNLFESTNVIIPNFSLDPNDFEHTKIQLEEFINDQLNNNSELKNKPFILVHYGVLERMYKGNINQINQTLTEWAEKAKRIVVTSGRGAHSLNLPPSVCFANLSSVLYACVENRNKYMINYLLNQSRRKNG